MAVNPYSTPLKTEYKPLGLEAFAEPLSKMQAKFDTVKTEIEAADFALARLDKDDPRAKSLVEEITSKRDQLAENLLKTGNYREAEQKLMQLNRAFNKDAETNAIKQNYETYQEAVKKQKERVEKGQITQKDFDLWDFKARHAFKGTNYDSKTGDYTSINVHPRMDNMEKEMRDEALKLAGMAAVQGIESWDGWSQIDPIRKERIKESLKYRDVDQVAKEIEGFLRTSDKYRDWVDETAEYEFYYNQANIPDFSYRFFNHSLNAIDGAIAQYNERLKDPQQAKNAQAQIDRLTKDRQKLIQDSETAARNGNFEDFAKQLFKKSADGRFEQLGYTASDIVDFRDTGLTATIEEDPFARERATKGLDKAQKIGMVGLNLASYRGESNTLTTTGGTTSDYDERLNTQSKLFALESMKRTNVESIPGLELHTKASEQIPVNLKDEFNSTAETIKDYHISIARANSYNQTIQERKEKVKELNEKMAKATSTEERTMIAEEIKGLNQDNVETEITLANEVRLFENIIEAQLGASYVDEATRNAYESTYKGKGLQGVIDYLDTLKKAEQEHYNTYKQPAQVNEELRMKQIAEWQMKNNRALTKEEEESMFPRLALVSQQAKSPMVKLAEDVMSAYRENISTAFYAVGAEIPIDASSNEMTNGMFNTLTGDSGAYIKNNINGQSGVKQVEFNQLTGKTKQIMEGGKFTLEAYEAVPHYVGIDQDGNTIMRYVRKEELDPNSKTVGSYVQAIKRKEDAAAQAPDTKAIKEFLSANPQDLYITVPGTTYNPTRPAQQNYLEIADAAMMTNNMEVFHNNLQNYSKFHILQSAGTREAYYKMASRLEDAVQEGHTHTELQQAPAYWHENQDGTQSGFSIRYKVVNGEIYADVFKGTISKDGSINWGTGPVATENLIQKYQNLPTALAAMDLMYGTGREEDLPTRYDGSAYVPAFMTPSLIGNK